MQRHRYSVTPPKLEVPNVAYPGVADGVGVLNVLFLESAQPVEPCPDRGTEAGGESY